MKKLYLVAIVIAGLMGSPAWALFETHQELAKSATITMDKAVLAAVTAIPGTAVEAELSKEDGRTVYKVEILDHADKTRTVYVDAQTMELKIEK